MTRLKELVAEWAAARSECVSNDFKTWERLATAENALASHNQKGKDV